MADKNVLKLGIPKGSLADSTIDLFARAGFNITVPSRGYYPVIDDPELSCIMFRAQEMSRYVEDGVLDCGLTGYDWIRENDSDVIEVCELVYSKATSRPARWVLAVPNESSVTRPEELNGGIISTELVNVTRRYFESKGLSVRIEFSWGATEVKARLLDAIVDVTETGSSLKANNLRIIDEILTSTPRFVANRKAWEDPWKREKIESIALLLRGAIEAKAKVGLKLNVARTNLDAVLKILPAELSPTVSSLADERYVAVEAILESHTERRIVPLLQKAGASGIIVYPLSKVLP
ncbi:MAG TPA: ATP phosphoribosyltransferase [Phycisphaerae bacterium]|nr:ATP phosphoribosyltransferase [Phycisphaerae bacterium]HOJ76103.1 ATP phosphoribosyltransferase [Phycisphaerae bacterium]HOM51855.1 ATP phosphoribosyltransferase [Phycisphaerae bacterium]HON65775.1 ATP phosphoribosyltransferase [Phycisphaerae bacterium]HOQ88116.1 ATP phosphoribosyltransferase [Phycisphaerae bacterium]